MRDPFMLRINQAKMANRVLGVQVFTPWNIGQLDTPTLDTIMMHYVDLPAMQKAEREKDALLIKLRG